jgi:hypothetical protein
VTRLSSTGDLVPSERRFLVAMQQMAFGRIEFLRIGRGVLLLNPWPNTVRVVKFCARDAVAAPEPQTDFKLKKQVVDFFNYVRTVDHGEIRVLEVHHGLPFSMEIEHCFSTEIKHCPGPTGGCDLV